MSSTFKRKRKRKDGSEYEVWVCEDEYEGTPKTITGKTEKEAKSKMKAWLKEMTLYGESLKKSNNNLANYALNYYKTYKKDKISLNSYRCYMTALNKHIIPALGDKEIKDVTKLDLQKFFNSKGNYAKDTVNIIKICMDTILTSAVDDNIIRVNPMNKITITYKSKKQTQKAMSVEQQKLYTAALIDEKHRLLFLTLLYTGLRIGECLALTWDDYKNGCLIINKSVGKVYVYDDNNSRHAEMQISTTKTKSSRVVPLPEFLKDELDNKQRDSDLIFHTSNNTHLKQCFIFRLHSKICVKAGIPHFSIHDLRHTYATRLLELNKSPKIVQTLLGHTNISTTMNTYTHVLDNIKVEAVNDLKLL